MNSPRPCSAGQAATNLSYTRGPDQTAMNGPCSSPPGQGAIRPVAAAAAALLAAAFGAGAGGCAQAPAPVEITFQIAPVSACTGTGAAIASVRVSILGARGGVECIEKAACAEINPAVRRIVDVQKELAAALTEPFDVLAGRGYQIEAVGYGTRDCSVGGDFRLYRFCGQSDPVRFDNNLTEAIRIPATCGTEAVTCAGVNASLRFCQ